MYVSANYLSQGTLRLWDLNVTIHPFFYQPNERNAILKSNLYKWHRRVCLCFSTAHRKRWISRAKFKDVHKAGLTLSEQQPIWPVWLNCRCGEKKKQNIFALALAVQIQIAPNRKSWITLFVLSSKLVYLMIGCPEPCDTGASNVGVSVWEAWTNTWCTPKNPV